MISQKLSRRHFLTMAAGLSTTVLVAACQPKVVEVTKEVEKVVKETVVVKEEVQKEITKVVEKEKVVTATPAPAGAYEMLKGKLSIAVNEPKPNEDGTPTVWEKISAAYAQAQPGVEFDYTYLPEGASADDTAQWIRTRQAAGQMPTLVYTSADNVTPAQENTGTAPWLAVDPYIQEVNPYTGNIWREDQDYDLNRWRSAFQGRRYIYGVATQKYKAAWMYNKTMFDKYGLAEPKSWTEWFTLMDTLKANGIVPLSEFGGAFRWSHFTWILFGSLGATDWKELAGEGNDFPSYERKLEWAYCGKWTQDKQWVREGYNALKKFSTYCLDGFLGMDIGTLLGQFTRGEAAMLYVDQGYLNVIDAARKDGLLDFEVSAFPTPQPDAGTFSQAVVDEAGPIADDGENYGAWAIATASVRQHKEENQAKMAIDFVRFLTTPDIQRIYVDDALNLPVNPRVEFTDPRIAAWLKNPKQIEYKFFFYGDRPTWYANMEGFLLDQITVDELITASNQEIKDWAGTEAKEGNITLTCD